MCGGAIIADFIQAAESSRRAKKDDVWPRSKKDGGRKKSGRYQRMEMQDGFTAESEGSNYEEEMAEAEHDVKSTGKVSEMHGAAMISDFKTEASAARWPTADCPWMGSKKSGRHQRMQMEDDFEAQSQGLNDDEEEDSEAAFQHFNDGDDDDDDDEEEEEEVEEDFEAAFQHFNDEAEDEDEFYDDEEDEDFEAQFEQCNDEEEDNEFDDEEEELEADVKSVAFGSKGPLSPECSTTLKSVDFKGNSAKLAEKKRKNKYSGICQCPRGKCTAEIKDPNRVVCDWLENFDIAEEAARAYDAEAGHIRGKKAKVAKKDT